MLNFVGEILGAAGLNVKTTKSAPHKIIFIQTGIHSVGGRGPFLHGALQFQWPLTSSWQFPFFVVLFWNCNGAKS